MDGLRQLLERAGAKAADVGYLAHGSTVATNAIVQRRLARTALITNEGFRDVLAIGTQMRAHVYDLWPPEPEPIVPRDLCLGVRGRLDAAGDEVEPLDADSVRAAAAALRDRGVEAVAVMLLFSFINDDHERRVGEILAEELPGTVVSLSSRVVPEFREYVRASTTALNASLLPLMGAYLGAVTDQVAGEGVSVPLHMMQTNGGVAPAARARELPIALSASGPAAGVIGGARLAQLVGESAALTFDMGGTTADIGLVIDGSPQRRFSGEAAGMPINLPQIDVLCIGSGGGSIARVDQFGSLTVGPASAGAEPGPAAYGLGGKDATVTDAHVVLGNLSAESALADGVPLDRELAEQAVTAAVGEPLGLGVEEAAVAILRIANANMANALRVMTIARGHDPRRFALVAIGGAGPMHACALADELGIPRVVVPPSPSTFSAWGMLATDLRHDLVRTVLAPLDQTDAGWAEARYDEMRREIATLLPGAGAPVLRRAVDLRYLGQEHTVTIALETLDDWTKLRAQFDEAHARAYGYAAPDVDIQLLNLRLSVVFPLEPPRLATLERRATGAPAFETRKIYSSLAGDALEYRVYQREALRPGDQLKGPAAIAEPGTTTIIDTADTLSIESHGCLIVEVK